jgi:hypothetical protein
LTIAEIDRREKAAFPKWLWALIPVSVLAASFATAFIYLERARAQRQEYIDAVNASRTAHAVLYQNPEFDPDFSTNANDPVTIYRLPVSYLVHVDVAWFRVEGSWVRVLDRDDPDVRRCCEGDTHWKSYAITTNGNWRLVPPPTADP